MAANVFILLVSLIGLLLAADVFVEAVATLARRLKISPMVVGLTVVAIGTSLPEVAASAAASLRGHPEIALGNVIGSNIANIGLIVALPALFVPVVCASSVVRGEGFLMVGLSALLFAVVAVLGEINLFVGLLFLAGFAVFLFWTFKRSREGEPPGEELAEIAEEAMQLGVEDEGDDRQQGLPSPGPLLFRVLSSLVVLLVSSEYLVKATVELARTMGVSENVIAISVIAIGTSLPELSVSFAAARRKQGDILIGNILGSNISNILLVLGVAAVINPVPMSFNTLWLDLPLMLAFAFAFVLFLLQPKGVGRTEGLVLLGMYGVVLWRCIAISP